MKQELEQRKLERPSMLGTVSINVLKGACEEYIDCLANGNYCNKDDEKQHIWEAAMMMFYGDDVWKWINERTT